MRTACAALCLAAIMLLAGCPATVGPEGRKQLLDSQAAYQRGDDTGAIETSSAFIKQYPTTEEAGEAYYVRGMARVRLNQPTAGKPAINSSALLAGKPAINSSALLAGKQDFQAALGLTKRKDLLCVANLALGNLAYDDGDMRSAEQHYKAVLDNTAAGAAPADQALYRLGCVLQRVGRWREADSYFARLSQLFDKTELSRRAELRMNATRWSVQAGAFVTKEAAEDMQRKLAAAGLQPRVDLEKRGEQIMHLVRVGNSPTFDPAQAELPRVQAQVKDAFVTPTH